MLKRAPEKLPSQEHLLLEYAQRLARFRAERRAVQIHLSKLRAHNRRGHHVRIAANTFEALVKRFEGQIFVLANGDIFFVCKGANVAVIDEAVMRVRYLFSEDPLVHDSGEAEDAGFCTWYDIERNYEPFMAAVQGAYDEEVKRQKRVAAITGEELPAAIERQHIDSQHLAELLDAIQRADLSNMMRRQAICAVVPNAPPQPIFREVYISIPDLRDIILPGYDLASDRWLFQHLTQTLDQRMLKMLTKNDDRAIATAFSVNLNVNTLLSDGFLQFDAGLRPGSRGTIVIELQLIDIFSDLASFAFARDFVKERGYRICLDGTSHLALPYIDRERLGLDLIKLNWRPDMEISGPDDRFAEFRKAIEGLGRARCILCHCDNEDAVEFGQACGINLFQGRHIDRLLASPAGTHSFGGLNKLKSAGSR